MDQEPAQGKEKGTQERNIQILAQAEPAEKVEAKEKEGAIGKGKGEVQPEVGMEAPVGTWTQGRIHPGAQGTKFHHQGRGKKLQKKKVAQGLGPGEVGEQQDPGEQRKGQDQGREKMVQQGGKGSTRGTVEEIQEKIEAQEKRY